MRVTATTTTPRSPGTSPTKGTPIPSDARSPGDARTRQERAAGTAVALKAAALVVFARRGYLNTKITDITAEAGRAAGSFYNHFTDKEDLLRALLTDALERARRGAGGVHEPHDLSDEAVLRAHVATFWNAYRDHRTEIAAMQQAAMVDEAFARWLTGFREAQSAPLRAHLEDLRERGDHLPGEPAVLAMAMVALLEQFCHQWFAHGTSGADDEAVDTLTGLIHHGIAGRPA